MIKIILKDKRGMALEMVLITTVLFFAICTIITTFALNSIRTNNFVATYFEERSNIDKIGDDYYYYLNRRINEPNYSEYKSLSGDKYYVKVENSNDNVILRATDARGKTILFVTYKQTSDGKYIVLNWLYGEKN